MSGPSPAFQFYTKEWLSSTKIMLMSPAQEGAYIRLLSIMWESPDCSIPDDDQQLSELSRLREGWFNGGSNLVRSCFVPFPNREGFLTNERLLKERQKQIEWKSKSSSGGLKSAAVRRSKSKGGSNLVSTKDEPKVNIAVRSSQFANTTPKGSGIDEQIATIWTLFPKKVAKGAAVPRIRQTIKTRGYEFVLEAVQAYAAAVAKWAPDKAHYVARASVWFKNEQYDDDRAEWSRNAGTNGSSPENLLGDSWSKSHRKTAAEIERDFPGIHEASDNGNTQPDPFG